MSADSGSHSGNLQGRPTESILGIGYSLLVPAGATGGAYELMQFVAPAGMGPPLHIHKHEDECFYVVEGELEILAGERKVAAPAGTYIHLPRQVPHGFLNVGSTTATFLCWVLPGRLASYFDQFKTNWPQEADAPPAPTEEDIERLMTASAEYEIEIVGGG